MILTGVRHTRDDRSRVNHAQRNVAVEHDPRSGLQVLQSWEPASAWFLVFHL